MPIHLRVLLVLHLVLFALTLFGAMISTSSEAIANFAISAWFAIVAFGIWAQLKIIRYAIWLNGLLGIGAAIFQAFFLYLLVSEQTQEQISLLELSLIHI